MTKGHEENLPETAYTPGRRRIQPDLAIVSETVQGLDYLHGLSKASLSLSILLLGAKGIATRSKDATRGSWPYY